MDQITPNSAGEFRNGWRNLAAATIGMGVGIAAYTPVTSFFFSALERDFGWSKVAAAGSLIALPITALALPIVGWLTDRFGVRLITGLSGLMTVLSYIWLSRMGGQVGEFYAAIIALNVLGCATGPVAFTRLVAAQFSVKRGMALAISLFGSALVSALMPQVISWIINGHGWRSGYLFFAIVTALGIVASQLLMQPVVEQRTLGQGPGVEPRLAIRTPSFWLLGLAILAISAAAFGPIAQFRAIFADRGIDLRAAASLLSLLAISVMVSRIFVGRLLDSRHPGGASAALMLIASIGAILLLVPASSMPLVAVAVVLLGFSIGGEQDLMSFFCARHFGLRYYGALYGLLSFFFYVGVAIGGIGYSAIRTRLGSYDVALLISAGLLMLSAWLMFLLERQKRPVDSLVSGVETSPPFSHTTMAIRQEG